MGFLRLVWNLPSHCFPAARTLFQIYLNFTKFWKPLGAEPWLQGKYAIKALWLELVPASKAQLLVCFISIPTCRHPQMAKGHRDSLLLLPGPAERGCHPARPSGNIPMSLCSGCLLQLEASKGFPTPGIRCWLSAVVGTRGKAKQFYVGSAAARCLACPVPRVWWVTGLPEKLVFQSKSCGASSARPVVVIVPREVLCCLETDPDHTVHLTVVSLAGDF